MPELPEVETVKRSLLSKIVNRRILSCTISEVIKNSHIQSKKAILKKQSPNEFEVFFQNVSIKNIERRSKYLIFDLNKNNQTFKLVSHLGMTGAWFVVDSLNDIEDKYKRHSHIIFKLDNRNLLVYCDARRFGEANIFSLNDFSEYHPVQSLGPEPFDKNALSIFLENTKLKKYNNKPIKKVIMTQQVLSGVGNIYACEALFLSKVHPLTPINKLSTDELSIIFNHIIDLLSYSISVGGASISDYVDSEGNRGSFQNVMKVYQQKTCKVCNHDIENITIEQRSSFYCPVCQTQTT